MDIDCADDCNGMLRVHEGTLWMFFKSKVRCELKLYEALQTQNIPCYLPLLQKTTEYSRRIYTRTVPMLGGGYVFASTVPRGYNLIPLNRYLFKAYYLDDYDAKRLLKDLLTVRKYEILAKTHKVEVMTDLKVNDPVQITHGYFKGEMAQVLRFKDHETVIVQLTQLPMTISVELPVDFVIRGS